MVRYVELLPPTDAFSIEISMSVCCRGPMGPRSELPAIKNEEEDDEELCD